MDFLLVAIGILGAFGMSRSLSQHRGKLVPYSIALRITDFDGFGTGKEAYSETKYVSARGKWRSVKTLPGGRTVEQYAQLGRGVFTIDHSARKMYFESPFNESARKIQEPRNFPNYVRSEYVMGIVTHVFRTAVADGYIEVFRAPELNGDIIKSIIKRGSVTRVIEPVSLHRGEPPAKTLNHQEYEVDKSRDKKRYVERNR